MLKIISIATRHSSRRPPGHTPEGGCGVKTATLRGEARLTPIGLKKPTDKGKGY